MFLEVEGVGLLEPELQLLLSHGLLGAGVGSSAITVYLLTC